MSRIIMTPSKVQPTARVFDMKERVIKFPFSQNATQLGTGIKLGAGLIVTDIFVKVDAAAAGTLNVGLGSNGDNLIDALSCAATGYKYRDVLESAFLPSQYGAAGGNYVNTAAGIAIGTTTTKIKSANAIEYTIDGIRYTKAATDDLWIPASVATSAVDLFNGCYLYLDAAGAQSVVDGTEAATLAGITWPDPVVAGKCCIGKITLSDSVGAFVAGEALTGGNVTVVYTDAVSGTNDDVFGLTSQLVPAMGGVRVATEAEIVYSTSAHAISGWVYVVVRGGFE